MLIHLLVMDTVMMFSTGIFAALMVEIAAQILRMKSFVTPAFASKVTNIQWISVVCMYCYLTMAYVKTMQIMKNVAMMEVSYY